LSTLQYPFSTLEYPLSTPRVPSPLQEISKRSVVTLVDLALGSERAARTGNTGAALAGDTRSTCSTRPVLAEYLGY
jgi:hypothetical protein